MFLNGHFLSYRFAYSCQYLSWALESVSVD